MEPPTLKLFRQASRKDHMNHVVWLGRADAAELHGLIDEAVTCFLTAASLLVDEGRSDEAARLARYVLHLRPDCAKAVLLLGLIRDEQRQASA